MASKSTGRTGFLGRITREESGNALMITAAAIVPLIAMIGSAVDISRIYLVKSRIQQACDAGALAGRRSMANGSWTSATQTVANNFFDTNFANNSYGTTGTIRAFTEDDDQVTGNASVTIPMAMMKFFGMRSRTLTVTCTSVMKIPNTDVMFVMDTTGSMANKAQTSDTQTKIAALRSAVLGFYDALETAKGANTQIRYGFVPYSVNVNVGGLLQRDWMVDRANYQSRKPEWTGSYTTASSSTTSGTKNTYTSTATTCPTNTYSSSSSQTQTSTASPYDSSVSTTVTVVTTTETGSSYSCTYSSKNKNYSITETRYSNYVTKTTTTKTPTWTWRYDQIEYDVSDLKGSNADGTMSTGTSITVPIGNLSSSQPTNKTVTWAGCIEERKTVQATDYNTVPSGTRDLDIDTPPIVSDDNTRWKPVLADLVYGRRNTAAGGSSWNTTAYSTTTNYYIPSAPCPSPARRLGEVDRTTLNTYLDALIATGNTYHDIGMLWGARLISPDGLFATENQSTPNGGTIARHIVFMTDGATEPLNYLYTSYGLEPLDQRRTKAGATPSTTDITNVINARLAYLCTTIKNKNITLWVVAFGTTLTTNLSTCASPNKAFQVNNAASLNATFAQIAAQISQLRLTN